MNKFFSWLLIFGSAIFLGGCTLNLPFVGQKKAALEVTANPKVNVFLNQEKVGVTPFFSENLKPGEYQLKLVPENQENSSLIWEARINLRAGVMTVVNRDLGENEEKSSGYILTLEPQSDKKTASVSIRTIPDGAVVSLNAEPKGFAPLSLEELKDGETDLVISSPGYVEKSFKTKLRKGYKLIVNVQLAKMAEEKIEEEIPEATQAAQTSPQPTSSPKASPKTSAKPTSSPKPEESSEITYVLIKSPQTGWLRVRKSPGGEKILDEDGKEVTVDDGQKYKWLETKSGWYKIEYEEGKEGWVSGQYAELLK